MGYDESIEKFIKPAHPDPPIWGARHAQYCTDLRAAGFVEIENTGQWVNNTGTANCPFCGRPPIAWVGQGEVWLGCSDCPAEMSGDDVLVLMADWNRRTG